MKYEVLLKNHTTSCLSPHRPTATTAGGVEQMYVHVVADNVGAKAFYEDFGFQVEAEESSAYAAGLSRPPRWGAVWCQSSLTQLVCFTA